LGGEESHRTVEEISSVSGALSPERGFA